MRKLSYVVVVVLGQLDVFAKGAKCMVKIIGSQEYLCKISDLI